MTLDRYGYNAIARHIFTGILAGALAFAGAGTLDWQVGWAFAVAYTGCWLVLSLVLARENPELLNVRGRRSASGGTKSWDWALVVLYSLLTLAQPFVAGLDYRYGWTGAPVLVVLVAGYALILCAFGLLTWAMRVNRFFEATVRIQTERGHRVTTGGPYQFVRHPGYSAVILTFIAVPLMLGSLVALGVGAMGIAVFVVRTRLEDAALHAELDGYADFARKTRWLLLPGVW